AGDPDGSTRDLRKFTQDPLKAAPVAPMALLQLAVLLRGRNKAAEAADVLNACRQAHESAMLSDRDRPDGGRRIRPGPGLCLKDAGKSADARAVFQELVSQTPDRPEAADALLRIGQCGYAEGRQKVEAARKQLAGKPKDEAAATQLRD